MFVPCGLLDSILRTPYRLGASTISALEFSNRSRAGLETDFLLVPTSYARRGGPEHVLADDADHSLSTRAECVSFHAAASELIGTCRQVFVQQQKKCRVVRR